MSQDGYASGGVNTSEFKRDEYEVSNTTRRIWNDTVETNKHKESHSSDNTVQAKKQTIQILDEPYRAFFEKVFIFEGHII